MHCEGEGLGVGGLAFVDRPQSEIGGLGSGTRGRAWAPRFLAEKRGRARSYSHMGFGADRLLPTAQLLFQSLVLNTLEFNQMLSQICNNAICDYLTLKQRLVGEEKHKKRGTPNMQGYLAMCMKTNAGKSHDRRVWRCS